MQYTKNYKMNIMELSDQYSMSAMNENVEKTDTELKNNADAISKEAQDRAQEIKQHKDNKNNPHEVTKEQVGLGKVENKNLDELFDLICPVGTIEYSATARTEENHWLLCDGREITREKYPKLYDAIGHTFNPDYDPNRLDSDQRVLLPNQLTSDGKPRALYGADSGTYKVGTYIEESLPNIKGTLYFSSLYSSNYSVCSGGSGTCGDKYKAGAGDMANSPGGAVYTKWAVDIDASKTMDSKNHRINNPAYKDPVLQEDGSYKPVNVFTNGIAVNMYIRW